MDVVPQFFKQVLQKGQVGTAEEVNAGGRRREPHGVLARQEPRQRHVAQDVELLVVGEQDAERQVDHVAGVRAEGPVGGVAVRDRHGRLDGERQLLLQHEEVRVREHFGDLLADLLVDQLPGPVAMVAVELLKGEVERAESPGIGTGLGQLGIQPQQRRVEEAMLLVERAQFPQHVLGVVLAPAFGQDLLGLDELLEVDDALERLLRADPLLRRIVPAAAF